jgi:catechol 2,3-dioxygenase-like lactoylglutathione lyase family enzyme
MPPSLSHVMLRVADMDRATAFWEGTLGFEGAGGGPFRFLTAGKAQIALNAVEGGDPAAAGSTTEIVLEVDDVRATHAAWSAAGVAFEVEPRVVMKAGGRDLVAAHFRDPDGHLVSVTGWVDG